MKQLVPALFLVFYTVSAVGLSIERTQSWVAEHAREGKHHQSKHGARIGEWHRRSPHQLQTKMLEDGSGLVSPFVRAFGPPQSEAALYQLLDGLVVGQTARLISSRAPPTAIS